MHARQLALGVLKELLIDHRPAEMDAAAACLVPAAAEIVDAFYAAMLENRETARFLAHDLVDQRLRAALAGWIRGWFSARTSEELEALVVRQSKIGEAHARVNVPMYLVGHGMRFLRREFSRRLVFALPPASLEQALLAVDDVIDYSVMLMNDVYLRESLRGEREAQSMRETLLGSESAVECERARASLFDWARQTVGAVHRNGVSALGLEDRLTVSSFGQWLRFKAEFMVGASAYLATIEEEAKGLDQALGRAQRAEIGSRELIDAIDARVARLSEALSELSERTLSADAGRDPLTRLLSRRYLPTVLRRETALSLAHDMLFALAVLDVDHFKAVNDRHGHAAGDMVLKRVAELLLRSVRTSDFVFRYGGEEFLLVLGNVDAEAALDVTDKLRRCVQDMVVQLDGGEVRVTVSVGIAVFDGHPDFNRLVARADGALYAAKRGGRNRCVLSDRDGGAVDAK